MKKVAFLFISLILVILIFGSKGFTDEPPISLVSDWSYIGTTDNEQLGFSLASGDFNDDGYGDLAVGKHGGGYAVFFGGPTGLALTPAINRTRELRQGDALTVCDFDGDGLDDLIVGSPAQGGSGRVLVLWGDASVPLTSELVVDATGITGAGLGTAVACSDVDGAGQSDIIAGAPHDVDPTNPYATPGSFVVYAGGMGRSYRDPTWKTYGDGGIDYVEWFGSALATADVNDDGRNEIVVGAKSPGDTHIGAVYIYTAIGGEPALGWTINGTDAGADFGAAVLGVDLDGDGMDDIVVGAPKSDVQNAGKMFVFLGHDLTYESPPYQPAWTSTAMTGEGAALAMLDFNSDGLADVATGASLYDSGRGLVAVYLGDGTTLQDVHSDFQGEQAGAQFGASLAFVRGSGSFPGLLVMGAPIYGSSAEGAVFGVHTTDDDDDTVDDDTIDDDTSPPVDDDISPDDDTSPQPDDDTSPPDDDTTPDDDDDDDDNDDDDNDDDTTDDDGTDDDSGPDDDTQTDDDTLQDDDSVADDDSTGSDDDASDDDAGTGSGNKEQSDSGCGC